MTSREVDFTQVHCNEHPEAPLIEDYRAGDQICSECALVVGDRVINVGSEWRTFSNEEAEAGPSRVGGAENPLLNGSGLTTITGGGRGMAAFDEFGNAKYHSQMGISSGDRALMNAFKEIDQMADRLHLSKSIVDHANALFKMNYGKKTLKGRSNDAIAAACLCLASRQEGVPQSFKEICAVSKYSKKEIARAFRLIVAVQPTSVKLITTGDFMSRFCSKLSLPNSVERAATAIGKTASDLEIVFGRSPLSVAAAAIYMASQASEVKLSQKEIGVVAGVTDVTIRKVYRQMYPRAVELFPKDFVFFTPISELPLG